MSLLLAVMVRWLFFVVLSAPVVSIFGCAESQRTATAASLEGIKLSDLEPASVRKLPQNIHFHTFVFEMPSDSSVLLKDIFEQLSKSDLHFTNGRAFKQNGFAAGFGIDRMWNKVAEILRRAQAKKAQTRVLILFEDTPGDITAAKVSGEQTVFYITANGDIRTTLLANGQLAWRINAEPIAGQRDTSNVKICPVFMPAIGHTIAQMAGGARDSEIIFDSTAFTLRMSSGDFVVLGPEQYNPDAAILSSAFFTLRGDIVLPADSHDKTEKIVLRHPNLKLYKDVPLIRIYLIVCMGTGN